MATRHRTRPFNRLRLILDADLTVVNALDKAVEAHGDTPLFFFDEPPYCPGLSASISPRAMRDFANRVANVLCGEAEMARYDRVAICKANAGDYFFLGVAVMRAGGIAVPINGELPPDGLGQYLDYTGATVVITDSATWRRYRAAGRPPLATVRKIIFTDSVPEEVAPDGIALSAALERAGADFEPVDVCSDDDVLIVHTSGTTGFPKGVIHTSGSLVAGIKGQLKIEPVFRDNVALTAAPFNHFINYLGLLSALVAHVPTWLVGRPDAKAILDLIDREKIAVVFCFPHTFLAMYEHGLDRHDLGSVRLWLAGADSSHEAHIRAFTRKGAFMRVFGRPVLRAVYADTLGSSEVGFAALFRFAFSFSRRFQRYAGRPTFAGPKVKIADAAGRKLPPGKIGRVMVKGPTLFKGYWNAHDKLHGVVRDGWWWTGDVGYRDRFGRFYHYDRATDVIRVGSGAAVHTLPLEEIILNYPGVAEAVVVGRAASRNGSGGQGDAEEPIAFVQMLPGCSANPEEILAWTNARLSEAERIAELTLVSAGDIPRGLTGKVLKRVLRDRFSGIRLTAGA
jgi:acyl-coenzyme A synthetase/AMP-(fatty) acid ligase